MPSWPASGTFDPDHRGCGAPDQQDQEVLQALIDYFAASLSFLWLRREPRYDQPRLCGDAPA